MKEYVGRGRYLSINAYLHIYVNNLRHTEVILKETMSPGDMAQWEVSFYHVPRLRFYSY